jgi:hypothetical protein
LQPEAFGIRAFDHEHSGTATASVVIKTPTEVAVTVVEDLDAVELWGAKEIENS